MLILLCLKQFHSRNGIPFRTRMQTSGSKQVRIDTFGIERCTVYTNISAGSESLWSIRELAFLRFHSFVRVRRQVVHLLIFRATIEWVKKSVPFDRYLIFNPKAITTRWKILYHEILEYAKNIIKYVNLHANYNNDIIRDIKERRKNDKRYIIL